MTSLSSADVAFLNTRCAALQDDARRLRKQLDRLQSDADGPLSREDAAQLARRLVAWIERAQGVSAQLHLIRTSARQAGLSRLDRAAKRTLRRALSAGIARLIELRATHQLRRLAMPSAQPASLLLPSGHRLSGDGARR